jgi:hypothetical protein
LPPYLFGQAFGKDVGVVARKHARDVTQVPPRLSVFAYEQDAGHRGLLAMSI